MTTPHTTGKLRVGRTMTTTLVSDKDGPGVPGYDDPAYGGFMVAESIHPENARRLAACWNALEGVTTDDIENKSIAEIVSKMAYISGFESGSLHLQGGALMLLADSFAGQFKGSGATNFLELRAGHPEIGDFTVTMQRAEGTTPAQKISELRALLHRVTQDSEWSCMDCQLQDDIAKALGLEKTPALPIDPPTPKKCAPGYHNWQQDRLGGYICSKCQDSTPF